MRFDVITIFPEVLKAYFNSSILARAQKKGIIKISIHDLRDFSTDKRHKVDDKPYGGGPGMVFKIEPLVRAVKSLKPGKKTKIILLSATGKQFNSKMAQDCAKKYKHIILITGHYEGIDSRIKKIFPIEEISIGNYVLTGGEVPAMVLVDAVSRHIPGVLGKEESLEEKRYGVGVPVYTRPEIFKFKGKKISVPKILLSGNHKKIEEWRKKHKK